MRVAAADDVYIEAPPREVHRALLQAGPGTSWWPGARLTSSVATLNVRAPVARARRSIRFTATVGQVRPGEGLTWHIESGVLAGTGEWWLEPFGDGVIVHHILDAQVSRLPARTVRRYRWAIRRAMLGLKDSLEARGVPR